MRKKALTLDRMMSLFDGLSFTPPIPGLCLFLLLLTGTTGCSGIHAMAEKNVNNKPLYFKTPAQAVEMISRMLMESDWKKLSNYYDLSGAEIKREELESGSFFKYQVAPPGLPFMRQLAIKHPFTPGYKYERHSHEDGGRVRVYLRIEIDEGGGMVQESLAAFMMIKSAQGFQILPEIVSYFDNK